MLWHIQFYGIGLRTISEYENVDPNPAIRHVVVGLAGSDSCFMKQSILFEVNNWENPEVAAVRVMLQYMTDRDQHNKTFFPQLTEP